MKNKLSLFLPWLKRFKPVAVNAPPRERLRATLGACLGMVVSVLACMHFYGLDVALRVAAPIGASAVLLFAVPSSPLAQPWSIVGGNVLAAGVGALVGQWIDHTLLAAAVAMAATIIVMFSLRCLHPPGIAVVVSVSLGGPAFQQLGLAVMLPVALCSLIVLAGALIYNNLTRLPYPKAPPVAHPHKTHDPLPSQRTGFTSADLEQALKSFGAFVDITPDALEALVRQTERHAVSRRMGAITAAQIMSRDVLTATPHATIRQAWDQLETHHLKVLPVLTEERQLIGIVTLTDLFRHIASGHSSETPVEVLMTRTVQCVQDTAHLADLVPLLSDHGLHCLPVLDEQGAIAGVVSQTDLIAALYQHWLKNVLTHREAANQEASRESAA
ncbi:CBS domain-containing membrane protein [Pseudomonas duriflava]|uniref:CBS domain-containing membrane protein n=1 Tax=Pseudomonas duriflava TaxID=459528 RepID=A0A562QRE5_9PSED|nr:HPP family protein [Pseudomonas duriflava]TWI58656.1 CBS domain-containing membrane protein [Pseudomonas duriflava]